MNDTMSISPSSEDGMYLLREGESLWRVNEDGVIDCMAQGHSHVFELLSRLQQWKTPSRSLLQNPPMQDPSNR